MFFVTLQAVDCNSMLFYYWEPLRYMCAVINIFKKIQTEHKETAPSVLPGAQDLLTDIGVETHALL